MANNWMFFTAMAGLYVLCGLLYSLVYLMAYKPKEGATALGLMMLGWPIYIVLEIVLQVAHGFGRVAQDINIKLKGMNRAPEETR